MDPHDAETRPDRRAYIPAAATPNPWVAVDVGAITHPGKVRTDNEDQFHVVRFGRYLRTVLSSLPVGHDPEEDDRGGHGFVVADGMGGHAAGEVASRRAITLLLEYSLRTPDWILGMEDALLDRVMERVEKRFKAVNAEVLAEARTDPKLKGMGTTLSMALSLGEDLIVANVGDSPAYLYRDGRLLKLTRDHNVAQEMAHCIPEASRYRHVLTRVIGSATGDVPDLKRYRLADGDRLLLCTDGLTAMAADEDIARELGRGSSAEACEALVSLALNGGGKDNVTVIVATYRIRAEVETETGPG